ncbi:MAG: DUF456 domain-containing protein [Actinomycetota bacterium]|nr:DUF456 domain-containing protein [Actinomycetota bacterium]
MTVLLAGTLMVVGLVGIVVPVLPGLVLVLSGVVLWAALHADHRAWVVVAVAVIPYVAGVVTRYVVPGRRLRGAGVGSWTLALAVVLAVVGGLVMPVVGALVGFVGGILAIELARYRDLGRAWRVTRSALAAVGLSVLVELAAGGAIVTTWLAGLVLLGPG